MSETLPPLDFSRCARCAHDIDDHNGLGCRQVVEEGTGERCDCRRFTLRGVPCSRCKREIRADLGDEFYQCLRCKATGLCLRCGAECCA